MGNRCVHRYHEIHELDDRRGVPKTLNLRFTQRERCESKVVSLRDFLLQNDKFGIDTKKSGKRFKRQRPGMIYLVFSTT